MPRPTFQGPAFKRRAEKIQPRTNTDQHVWATKAETTNPSQKQTRRARIITNDGWPGEGAGRVRTAHGAERFTQNPHVKEQRQTAP